MQYPLLMFFLVFFNNSYFKLSKELQKSPYLNVTFNNNF